MKIFFKYLQESTTNPDLLSYDINKGKGVGENFPS